MAATGALSAGTCDLPTKRGWEELPHVWGWGRSREDLMPEGRQLRGLTPRLRSEMTEKNKMRQRRNCREELFHDNDIFLWDVKWILLKNSYYSNITSCCMIAQSLDRYVHFPGKKFHKFSSASQRDWWSKKV